MKRVKEQLFKKIKIHKKYMDLHLFAKVNDIARDLQSIEEKYFRIKINVDELAEFVTLNSTRFSLNNKVFKFNLNLNNFHNLLDACHQLVEILE